MNLLQNKTDILSGEVASTNVWLFFFFFFPQNGDKSFPVFSQHIVCLERVVLSHRIHRSAEPLYQQQGRENKSTVCVTHVRYMCDTGRTVWAAVTSIFQREACCLKECSRGRPPPGALSEPDRRVNSDAAWVAAVARAASARWLPPMGLWHSPTTTLANGASVETHARTHTHTHTQNCYTHTLPPCISTSVKLLCLCL